MRKTEKRLSLLRETVRPLVGIEAVEGAASRLTCIPKTCGFADGFGLPANAA